MSPMCYSSNAAAACQFPTGITSAGSLHHHTLPSNKRANARVYAP